ncbi:MAG: DUF3347 domain-containing protein [Chitinophagaceae bacterium]|nr:DUF3347 domain-containing protein [Chitinophagaceae bacterium]
MKKFFAILLLIIIVGAGSIYLIYFRGGKRNPKGPKPVPMAVSKHSDAFNTSVQQVLAAYYGLSEALVNWDTASSTAKGTALLLALDSLRLDELKADTTGIYQSAADPLQNARAATQTLLQAANLEARRHAFQNISENIRLLIIVVRYDREKLYWQECPMAFGEDEAANWLSKSPEIRNPYLGLHHPDYKDGMLGCGETKATIDYTAADTTQKK